jgi:hypothetical protein
MHTVNNSKGFVEIMNEEEDPSDSESSDEISEFDS